jgi:hypothetical protein
MKRSVIFLGHLFGFLSSIVLGPFSSTANSDVPAQLSSRSDSSELISIRIDNKNEVNELLGLIRLLNLEAEVVSFGNSEILLRMPKDHKLVLAGQIWRED